jgi:hypothetical protein
MDCHDLKTTGSSVSSKPWNRQVVSPPKQAESIIVFFTRQQLIP